MMIKSFPDRKNKLHYNPNTAHSDAGAAAEKLSRV